MKAAMSLAFLSPYIIANLKQIANGQRPSNQLPNKLLNMAMVSLGPTYGIMIANGLVIGNDGMAAGKFEVTD